MAGVGVPLVNDDEDGGLGGHHSEQVSNLSLLRFV
jgi:hypothetical protein